VDNFLLKLALFALLMFSSSVYAVDRTTAYQNCRTYQQSSWYTGQADYDCKIAYTGSTAYNAWFKTTGGVWYADQSHSTYFNWTGSDCPSGQTWSETTHSCSVPCAVGATAQLTQFTPIGTLLTLYIGKGPDLVQGGCTYSCNSEQTYEKYDTTGVYATYSCTGTGVVNNTATTVSKPTDAVPVVLSAGGQTCSSKTGKNVCVGGDIPAGCSYINGVKTCPSGTNSATVGISPPLASTASKNCGRVNGNVVCVQPSGTSNNVLNAVSLSGSAAITYEQGVKTVSTVSPTVANPDGSTTQTTTNTTNIYGEPDGVTTVDTSNTGVATTTKTGGATGSGSVGNDPAIADAAKSAALAECAKPENQGTLGCAGFGDIPTQETISTTAVTAALSVGSYDVGSCPASQTITTSHGNITMSNTPICNLATGIKPLNLAIAYLAAGFIVFGAVRS